MAVRRAYLPSNTLGLFMQQLSKTIAVVEARFAGAMIVAILVLLLSNVVSRGLGNPLIWTDELAVYLMVVGAFAGASLGISERHHIAVTLLADAVSEKTRRIMAVVVDTILLLLMLLFAWMLWNWFDPVNAFAAESLKAYSLESFNFIYQEPTTTLGVRKIWFWLILPIFCLTATVHILARFGSIDEKN